MNDEKWWSDLTCYNAPRGRMLTSWTSWRVFVVSSDAQARRARLGWTSCRAAIQFFVMDVGVIMDGYFWIVDAPAAPPACFTGLRTAQAVRTTREDAGARSDRRRTVVNMTTAHRLRFLCREQARPGRPGRLTCSTVLARSRTAKIRHDRCRRN